MKTGFWNVTRSGRHYHDEHYDARKVHDCALSNDATRVACGSLLSPEMGDYVNLHVAVDGAGVVTISDAIRVTVNGAQAQSLGLTADAPTTKP